MPTWSLSARFVRLLSPCLDTLFFFFFFQAEDGIRDGHVTGVQTCALPISSGPGGQGVNTTDSAVQIVHKPSGLIVRCADGRSQQKNKQQALTVLRSRLLEQKVAEENAKYAAQRKAQVGTGERNERIRTYNFPQNRVTDHRIELTLYNLPAVIDGDVDPLIEPLMAHDLEQRLAASAR